MSTQTATHPQQARMDAVRDRISRAAKAFGSDLDIHCEACGTRSCTDDLKAYHTRQITLASILRWNLQGAASEFHLKPHAVRVPPRLFGRLQAMRCLVTTVGENFPASRMEADRLLAEANDLLNTLSVMLEADRAF